MRSVVRARRLLAVAAVALGVAGAWAGAPASLDDDVKAALAARKKKDAPGTVAALEAALKKARADAPFELRQVVPINHNHTGLGLYAPAEGGVIDGRVVRFYVEVANYRGVAVKDLLDVTLEVRGRFRYFDESADAGPAWTELGEFPLGTQHFQTRTDLGVTSFGVEVKLGEKSPAGRYEVALTVVDKNNADKKNAAAEKTAAFSLR